MELNPVCVVTIITVSPTLMESCPLGMMIEPLRLIKEISSPFFKVPTGYL